MDELEIDYEAEFLYQQMEVGAILTLIENLPVMSERWREPLRRLCHLVSHQQLIQQHLHQRIVTLEGKED